MHGERKDLGFPARGRGVGKVALITGITGQDGSYLSELLLEKGYEVHGISAVTSHGFIHPDTNIHYVDLADGANLNRVLDAVRPEEVYHLAAQSHVRLSFDVPVHTGNVT